MPDLELAFKQRRTGAHKVHNCGQLGLSLAYKMNRSKEKEKFVGVEEALMAFVLLQRAFSDLL